MAFGCRTTAPTSADLDESAAIWRAWADELSGNWLMNIAANAGSLVPPASIFVQ